MLAPPQVVHVPQMAKSSTKAQSASPVHGLHTLASPTQKVPPSTDVAQNPAPLSQRGTATPQESANWGHGTHWLSTQVSAHRATLPAAQGFGAPPDRADEQRRGADAALAVAAELPARAALLAALFLAAPALLPFLLRVRWGGAEGQSRDCRAAQRPHRRSSVGKGTQGAGQRVESGSVHATISRDLSRCVGQLSATLYRSLAALGIGQLPRSPTQAAIATASSAVNRSTTGS